MLNISCLFPCYVHVDLKPSYCHENGMIWFMPFCNCLIYNIQSVLTCFGVFLKKIKPHIIKNCLKITINGEKRLE